MFSTRPRRTRKPSPNHELIHHGYIRGTRLRRTSPDGGLYIYHALAFSTLLSSQETDAHLWRNFHSPPGQPLNLTLEFLSCQLSFRNLSGRLPTSRHSSHRGSASVSLVAVTGTRETFGNKLLGGSPGPGPPSGVPSPSGQDELYGSREPPSNRGFYPVGIPVLTCPN